MTFNYGTIPTNEILINPYERAKRLQVASNFNMDEFDKCFEKLKVVVDCKYLGVKVPVKRLGGSSLDCGFGEFESEKLLKNLKDCNEAFVFCVTLGIGVDRLLNKLKTISPVEYFITDSLSSALAEGAMDKAEKIIKGETLTRPRFSPGFGDFGIELQPRILELLNAPRLLGMTVNKSYLMLPMKSVTAVMGII
ncbi:MAG: hypothetical protein IKW62_00790 [Clostridia bacterium]|nr:hypothetical protein [Clostridia bacterium]